ncbi:MAG: family 16 glycoside hydrolase [Isosphaeraceae bacterium]
MTDPRRLILPAIALLATAPGAWAAGDSLKTFTYKTTPSGPLEMTVHYPNDWKATDRRPAVVFFFGGGWTSGKVEQFLTQAEHFARRGMVAARADYRVKSRHGVTPDRCIEDAKRAVRWLRSQAATLGVDPNRIVAAGGSAGGHIAACTALTDGLDAPDEDASVSSRPNALLLYNPVLRFDGVPSLMARIGDDEALGKRISPTIHVSRHTPPSLLLYGTADRLYEQGQEVQRRAWEVGAATETVTAEGQGHGFFNRSPWRENTTDRADAFLTRLGYLEPPGGGWIDLFDGETLDGWAVRGGNASYKVEDGAIVGTTVEGSPNTFLCKGDFQDFVLEVDVKCDPRLNSGVQIRSHVYSPENPDPAGKRAPGVVYGPQCEIALRESGTAGRFYDEGRRGKWLCELAPETAKVFKDDDWNHYRIVARGDRYRSWVNGVACSDFTDDLDASGFIGLQVHGIAKGTGPFEVRWRNVHLRPLRAGEDPGARD